MTDAVPVVATPTSDADTDAARRSVARAMLIGLWVWPSFAVLDAWMSFVAYPGAPFVQFLTYRVVVELAFLGVYRASRRGTFELKRLFWLQNVCYGTAALAIALMAIDLGGVRSPYMHGISVVALVRAALVPTHWRNGMRTYGRIALAFPLVMGIGAIISPAARAEWLTLDSLVVFASNYVFVVASSFLGLMTGHIVWRAKEQLYRARRVGRYRLQAPIGKGGMGEVWLAWDLSLERNVALKILRVGTTPSPESVRRFELEAQAAGRLRGRHVAQIFDFGASEDGLYYIAMEYLVGMNLGDVVSKFGPLAPQRAIKVGIQACLALEEAHAADIIHRDLKPHNLFLTHAPGEPDLVKLLDFGVARLSVEAERGEPLTQTGMIVGTPVYLAPELWQGAPADARSDIYALGVTLCVLLTGATPFDGLSVPELQRIHFEPDPPPLELPETVLLDPRLEALLLRCLARSAGERVQSARELRAELAMLYDPAGWTAADAEEFWKAVERERFG